MAAASGTSETPEASDTGTINVENCTEGTYVRLLVRRPVKSSQITPIFEDLGINIVSFDTERDPLHQAKKQRQNFRGTFLVTDDDGLRLSDTLLQQLVDELQTALHVRLTAGPIIKKSESLHKSDSVSSNLSVASDPLLHPLHNLETFKITYLTGSEVSHNLFQRQGNLIGQSTDQHHTIRLQHQRTDSCASHPELELTLAGNLDRRDSNQTSTMGSKRPSASGSVHCESLPGIGQPARLSPLPPLAPSFEPHINWNLSTQQAPDESQALNSPSGTGSVPSDVVGTGGLTPGGLSHAPSSREDENVELAAGHQTVDCIMNSPVHSIHKDADLNTAKSIMSELQVSALLVDTGSNVPGFITKRDFLKVSFSKTLRKARVQDIMTQPVICINVGTSLREAVRLMAMKGVRRVLVFEPSRENPADPLAPYVGLVSDTDIFRVLGRVSEHHRDSRPLMHQGHISPTSDASRPAASLAHYQSTMSSISGVSMGSLAHSISSISEQAKAISTEDRYRAAAALWELDYNEIEIMRKIGEGSFGEVVLAGFRGTKVAVKRMRGFEISGEEEEGPSPTMMPVFAQFFEREIEIMASIRHPNVVNFIGACHTPPNVCLVTEYCARGSLDHLLHKSGLHLDIVKKIEFGMDIARGMSCLHAQRPPIVHRDLKPANLLVSARFEVKVADFGLSRIKDHAQLINSRAGLEGTIEYCAPEVLRGEPYTEKCDIWSYGVVTWELLNRQRPFADADVPIYILMMALGTGSLSLAPLREEASSPGLVRMVERCLSRQPADRPSFREILHILENEYKMARGKAAAVPRSDSAHSVVVLGGHSHNASSEQLSAPSTPPHLHHVHGPNAPPQELHSPARPTPPFLPAQVAHALAGPHRLGVMRAHGQPGPGSRMTADDAVSTGAHEGAGGQQAAPIATSRLARQAPNQTNGVANNSGSGAAAEAVGSAFKAPRPRMVRMSRARSTPLPAHMWFGEQGENEWDGQEGAHMEQPHADAADEAMAATALRQGASPPRAEGVIGLLSSSMGLSGSVLGVDPAISARVPSRPQLSNIPEGHVWHEDGTILTDQHEGSIASQRSGSSASSGLQSLTNVLDELAARSGSGPLNHLQQPQQQPAKSIPPRVATFASPFANGDAITTTSTSASGSGGSFPSPFDGFLPFSDIPSPETPRINTPSVEGPDAMLATISDGMQSILPLQTEGVVDTSGDAGVSRPSPTGPPPHRLSISSTAADSIVAPVVQLVSQRLSSPFSAFCQEPPKSDDEVSPPRRAPAAPAPAHAGPLRSLSKQQIPVVQPQQAARQPQQHASSAPAAMTSMGKTGSFFSPFAPLLEPQDADICSHHSHAGTDHSGGCAGPSDATLSELSEDVASSSQQVSASSNIQASRGASGALPLGLCEAVGVERHAVPLQLLSSRMSMSLSMDTSSPVGAFSHVDSKHSGVDDLVFSPSDTSTQFIAVPDTGAAPVLTRKSSASFGALYAGVHAQPGTPTQRHGLDKQVLRLSSVSGGGDGGPSSAKAVGSPQAGASPTEGEVTVHQISWVKV